MGCPVVHFEIGCRDKDKTKAFFGKMFGWAFNDAGPATMIDTQADGAGIQGHISSLGHEPHNFTNFYVQVEDVAASLEKASSLGGKTLVPPVTIPSGTFAWFSDPEGNMIGLWKPAGK
jgi:predicted enzyme related to lactoylglutathione lyase